MKVKYDIDEKISKFIESPHSLNAIGENEIKSLYNLFTKIVTSWVKFKSQLKFKITFKKENF